MLVGHQSSHINKKYVPNGRENKEWNHHTKTMVKFTKKE